MIHLLCFLYKLYLNQDYSIANEKMLNGRKIENGYIDKIVINSLKKHFYLFEPLLIFSKDSEYSKRYSIIKKVLMKYDSNLTNNEYLFIEQYKVDLKEIDALTLELLTNFINNKAEK